MARTQFLPTNPATQKAWSARVALDSKKKCKFDRLTGEEGSSMPVVYKTDLEKGPGDEVTTTLVAKLRGKPIEGQEKAAGREMRVSSATHTMRIDKHRQLVNVGDVMDQKRVGFNIRKVVIDKLSDYMAEVYEEQIVMTLSGGRGIGTDEIQHYPVGYAGFPNAFRAPDAQHQMFYDGTRANAAALTASDKLGTNVIDKLKLRAAKQVGGQPSKPVRMEPVNVDGGKHFLYMAAPESMYDLRREVGDAGWLTLEKAKMTAEGAKSSVVQGGKAYYNGVVIDEIQTCVKFDTTTAGGSYGVPAARNLFLGANAALIAHGTGGQRDGNRFELSESDLDHGEESVVIVRMIAGFDKANFNGMDFGVIANDLAYTAAT